MDGASIMTVVQRLFLGLQVSPQESISHGLYLKVGSGLRFRSLTLGPLSSLLSIL